MSAISRDEVAHLARLSRLALSDEELDSFADQLDSILQHVRTVTEIDTADVPAMSHPVSVDNVLREDEVRPGLAPEAAVDQAPEAEDDRFVVPRILGEE